MYLIEVRAGQKHLTVMLFKFCDLLLNPCFEPTIQECFAHYKDILHKKYYTQKVPLSGHLITLNFIL